MKVARNIGRNQRQKGGEAIDKTKEPKWTTGVEVGTWICPEGTQRIELWKNPLIPEFSNFDPDKFKPVCISSD